MLIKQEIFFRPANENRTIHIYYPDDCFQSGERYPVMYFFDGHNLFLDEDATYGKSWGMNEFMQSWKKDMIIVGVECSHHGYARLDEYSPYDFPSFFGGEIHGTGEETMEWLFREVKPKIDKGFPTWSHREATGICGSSMGGLMAIYAAAKYNHIFSKAACLSSAIHRCLPEVLRDIHDTKLNPDTRIYLSWGTEEAGGQKENPADDLTTPTAKANESVAKEFQKQGCYPRLYCQRGGHHCEADWGKQNARFMDFLWRDM